MYTPSPFLITSGALTSIFSFFFGEYFRERERVYKLWIRVMAYGGRVEDEEKRRTLCAGLESTERMFRQAKAFLWTILLTNVLCFLCFQYYSFDYFDPASPIHQPDAPHTWKWYTIIMGAIVAINCAELVYIRVVLRCDGRFPFLHLRKRVTGQERLSMIWQMLECPCIKRTEFNALRIPGQFYRDLEDPENGFKRCYLPGNVTEALGSVLEDQADDDEYGSGPKEPGGTRTGRE